MERPVSKLFSLFLLFGLAFSSPAEIYKWVDEHGRVQFGDRPYDEAAKKVKVKPQPVSEPASVPDQEARKTKQQRMLEVYREQRLEKKEAAAKAKQKHKERKRKCLRARANYQDYQSSAIYDLQEDGSRVYFDKPQREQYLARLKAEVERWCK